MVTHIEAAKGQISEFDPQSSEEKKENLSYLTRLTNLVSFVNGADIEFSFRNGHGPEALSIQNFPARTHEERWALNLVIPGTYNSRMVKFTVQEMGSSDNTTYLFFNSGQAAKVVSANGEQPKIIPLNRELDCSAVQKNLTSIEGKEFKLSF